MTLRKRRRFLIPALILAFFTGACASKPFLKVQYQLPSPSNALQRKQVSLTVSDMRSKETLVTESARKSLRDFKGTFSLVVLRDDGSGNLRGAYDVVSLFSEVFEQRLNNEGIQAISSADSTLPELRIEITEFQIDFVARKWIVGMNYQASIIDNGNLLSKESVSGQAERLKVMGRKGVEKVLSELLTDVVNKLNLAGLFQQARL